MFSFVMSSYTIPIKPIYDFFSPCCKSQILDYIVYSFSKVLVKNASEKQRKDLSSGLDFLLSNKNMGTKFKVFSFNQISSIIPAGF